MDGMKKEVIDFRGGKKMERCPWVVRILCSHDQDVLKPSGSDGIGFSPSDRGNAPCLRESRIKTKPWFDKDIRH